MIFIYIKINKKLEKKERKLFSVKYNSIVISKNPKMMYSYVTQIKFF